MAFDLLILELNKLRDSTLINNVSWLGLKQFFSLECKVRGNYNFMQKV